MKRHTLNKNAVKPKKYETHIISPDGNVTRQLAGSESHRAYVPARRIPKYLTDAIISVEDQHFYEHHGIDMRGLLRSIVVTVSTLGKKLQGGSTLTQQLVKNTLFPDWYTNNTFKSKLKRKGKEIYLSIKLERTISKVKILENYLNVIYFGNGRYGVQAAAKLYFGKNVWELTLGECALLAGIPISPGRFDPFLNPDKCMSRRNLVLYKMYTQNRITQDEYLTEKEVDLSDLLEKQKKLYLSQKTGYSYFEEGLLSQLTKDLMTQNNMSREAALNKIFSGGLRVLSTEDSRIQRFSEKVFSNSEFIPELRKKNGPQAAMLLMDSETGHILATVGGRGKKKASLIFNRAISAKRNHHLKAMETYFDRTNYIPKDDTGICITDICLAYANYESREKTNHASFYKKVYDYRKKEILVPETRVGEPPKNDSLSYQFHAPLPPMIEITFETDIWVVGRIGTLILGVWGGYDDNRSLPLSEKYYTYPRKIWKEIAKQIER